MKNATSPLAFCILHFAFCILLVAVPPCSRSAFAQSPSEPPKIVGVRVGVADCYKVGLWTPVEVTLQGGGESVSGEVALIVPDGDGAPSRVATPSDEPCRIEAGQVKKVRLLCRFGRVRSSMNVELRADGKILAHRTFEAATEADAEHFATALEFQDLIVVVGDSTLGIEDIGKRAGEDPAYRPVAARVETLENLPADWRGYEGVDAVVIATSRPEIFGNLGADDPRMQSLDRWIQMGGRLVLCVGSQAETILAPNAPLSRFAPGRLGKMVPLRQTGALESYGGSRISVTQTGGKTKLMVPWLADVRGAIEAHEADLPLVIRTPRGFGQIIFVAVDLDRPPFDAWPDRPMLAAALLDKTVGSGEEAVDLTAMMHFGYSDVAGQLRSALDRFDGVQLAPFWLIAAVILVYLLLIGPGDYFFLKKIAARMQWTWLTFPVIVLLTCLGAYFLAYRLKGNESKINQAAVVDIDAASARLRGSAWLNFFSPQTKTLDLRMSPRRPDGRPLENAQTTTAWLGLSGTALGGMNPPTGDTVSWSEPYGFSSNLDAMRGVPIAVWSTKSFCARWDAAIDAFPQADLTDDNQLLTGAIVNTFDFPLRQCIVAHGRSVYELGDIAPGEAVRLGPMTKRSELKTLLTGRKFITTEGTDKYRQESTPYDQSSADVPYILRMMMFYEAAGGRRYTGLGNTYQNYVDLSNLLKADRAILVAQAPDDSPKANVAAALLCDGQTFDDSHYRRMTMFRIVYPVKK